MLLRQNHPTKPRRVSRQRKIGVESLEMRQMLSVDGLTHLGGDDPIVLEETVPVNVVFIGFEESEIDVDQFLDSLPSEQVPIVRAKDFWYGVIDEAGLHYDYDYDVSFASQDFEDAFFGEMSRIAQPREALTLPQQFYNDQVGNFLDIDTSYEIDAPATEQWLADNSPVDTSENTVFFINWWGRDDFLFHVYSKTGEIDPDTGHDFGQSDFRKVVAWGGTTADDEETGLGSTHRLWFYDLSAGPDWFTGNWNVDDADLDGGADDYRIPPAWEYDAAGYRSPDELTGDLGKLTRFVAIDLLFTPAPLYSAAMTQGRLPDRVNLDINTYDGIEGLDASEEYEDIKLLVDELQEVYPLKLTADQQELEFAGESRECFLGIADAYMGNASIDDICHADEGNLTPFANLLFDAMLKKDELLDGGNPNQAYYEHEVIAMNYATAEDISVPFLGFADDNWQDGTQSAVFSFTDPFIANQLGYGLTTTMIHEIGHHLALSHPHDGYDSEFGNFGPSGDTFFAWAGTEVNSIMSYIDLNWDFSQFDRDNMLRFLSAEYLATADKLAHDVVSSDGVTSGATRQLVRGDFFAGKAQEALAQHDYTETFRYAKLAYDQVRYAADLAGVEFVPIDGRTLPFQEAAAPAARFAFDSRPSSPLQLRNAISHLAPDLVDEAIGDEAANRGLLISSAHHALLQPRFDANAMDQFFEDADDEDEGNGGSRLGRTAFCLKLAGGFESA